MSRKLNSPLIGTKQLAKLYGRNQSEAIKLLDDGLNKQEVFQKTGVTVALWDVNLDIYDGEIFVIIGLSGSGKSTLVRCFNRLNHPTSGEIYFKGETLSQLSKDEILDLRRNKISMVFQHFGLMSHRSVLRNVEYGLEIKGLDKTARRNKALEMLELVGLKDLGDKSLDTLSGGMKQRVGLARALANDPEVLLMDEPFSALDPLVKQDMQFELLKIHQKMRKTIIFITHDINEAFKLGDRIAIMQDGKVVQIGTPEEMIVNPANEYVRSFIEGANRSQFMSVKNVMIVPSALIRDFDGPNRAIASMRANNVSSAYVVNQEMIFQGVITLDKALSIKEKNVSVKDYLITDLATVDSLATIEDVIPLTAETKFPIPVLEKGRLLGIISKAGVLSLLARNSNEKVDLNN